MPELSVRPQKVTGRLAPSPTGLLHLGHARSFLLSYWSARKQNGRVLLRIENLDAGRSKPELIDRARFDLEWLGLSWDGPASLQSDGVEDLMRAVGQLLEAQKAYACVCSRSDIRAAQTAPQQGVLEFRYPGSCRGRFSSVEAARAASGKDVGVRFMVPNGTVKVDDAFAGAHEFDVASEVGDFLIARRDGAPAYQLAVVIDDATQGVTEVVRGDDLLPSAARQQLLQSALGLATPRWYHVPLVVDEQGRRLAKRDQDLSLSELRALGVDPRVVVAWVANSAGMKVGDRVTADEVIAEFSFDRVPHAPITLDRLTLERLCASRA